MKIILCRHGETTWNVDGKIKGQIEWLQTTFTDKGNYQIEKLATFIKNNSIEAIFTSDMDRAYRTAEIVAKKYCLPVYVSEKFRGLNVGSFQGKEKKEFDRSDIVKRAFLDYDYAFPQGESVNQLIHRVMVGLNTIRELSIYENVAIITHGATISNIRAYLTNDKFQSIDYCIIQSFGQKWSLIASGLYKKLF